MLSKKFPYLPKDKTIEFVASENFFLQEAQKFAEKFSQDENQKTGAVLVLENNIVGRGANGSDFHIKNGCERKKKGIKTGESYEICEGCHPKNHAEQKAIADYIKNSTLQNSSSNNPELDLYLWGHWWCCQSCWEAMIQIGVKQVYLHKDSKKLFRR